MLATEQISLFKPSTVARLRAKATDIHAVSLPARTFTGDFYFTHRSGDRLWFAVGDVAGKGINAAVVMAMIQEELDHRITSCATRGCDPSQTVLRLHSFLRPLLPRNRFATVVIGWLRDDGTLMIANAGHCPPLIVRANGDIDEIGSTGPVAGILESPRWQSKPLKLRSGDALVLYSDGVIEARATNGDELGVGGLRGLLHRVSSSARVIATRIVDAIRAQADDDVTVVVLRHV